ncbi:PEP-CTERM sorting domain-containing protein [Parasphingorhabdus cellanae]|uniref:PEP-CTERM sorting domain-containing protein n=1 Tax=Parasphingorhabdus cellanae TaxID=2806553 RepID=A0ABX7T5Q9_9SPHN|nr:PEP-CTERM sorting domain-containing protein [Parasphingorhabdus cellanae]QTD56918.1 PEP-CTERM sorting domain-containing protein [Parasphingorhabdus cellanae]
MTFMNFAILGSAVAIGLADLAASIPEPSNILMLTLGVAGLVAGHMAASKKRNKL